MTVRICSLALLFRYCDHATLNLVSFAALVSACAFARRGGAAIDSMFTTRVLDCAFGTSIAALMCLSVSMDTSCAVGRVAASPRPNHAARRRMMRHWQHDGLSWTGVVASRAAPQRALALVVIAARGILSSETDSLLLNDNAQNGAASLARLRASLARAGFSKQACYHRTVRIVFV